MSKIARLHEAVAAVCPINGISGGTQATASIQFAPEATDQQKTAGNAALTSFDWSDAAQTAWLENQHPERKALRQAAAQAIADNDTYLAIASPNAAQVAAQVRRLTQHDSAEIRRLIQLD
jgi:hypothetical protein